MPTNYGLLGANMPQGYASLLGNQDLALALLANSGYQPTRQTFGQTLGNSMLQAQQMGQQRDQDALRKQYLEAQIATMNRGPQRKPVIISGPDGKPIYVAEDEAIGKSPYLTNDGMGDYQPGDYTPESWAKFMQTKDPSVLQRHVTPRQEFSPSFQNVTRQMPDGSTQQGTFNTRTGEYNWVGGVVPAGTKARVDAEGKAIGEAVGGQQAKVPAQKSMDYVISQFEPILDQSMQGMFAGPIGGVFDYGDSRRFDNLREQLSTELRTVFRIPGEGTLSDREQAQYGIQLPDRKNPAEVNRAILRDVRERVRLRLETPDGGQSASGQQSGVVNWADLK